MTGRVITKQGLGFMVALAILHQLRKLLSNFVVVPGVGEVRLRYDRSEARVFLGLRA